MLGHVTRLNLSSRVSLGGNVAISVDEWFQRLEMLTVKVGQLLFQQTHFYLFVTYSHICKFTTYCYICFE